MKTLILTVVSFLAVSAHAKSGIKMSCYSDLTEITATIESATKLSNVHEYHYAYGKVVDDSNYATQAGKEISYKGKSAVQFDVDSGSAWTSYIVSSDSLTYAVETANSTIMTTPVKKGSVLDVKLVYVSGDADSGSASKTFKCNFYEQ